MGGKVAAAKYLFRSLATRWSAISTPVLSEFTRLNGSHPADEPTFQRFFERHPQLLDPMALQVWCRPDLHGYKEPEFVIRRTDDTYLVVEIETPAKALVTQSGQISADTTHAVGQVTQYRDFLMERFGEAAAHFPNFREPQGLVVIGIEGGLTEAQRRVLRSENQHRTGVQIVGFDWVGRRAEAIAHNLIHSPTIEQRLRMV